MKKHYSSALATAVVMVGVLASVALADNQKMEWKFTFGDKTTTGATTQVSPTATYSGAEGFGFEPGAAVELVTRKDAAHPAGVNVLTSSKPFYFSAAVPEGNYKVTVTLGDPAGESMNTIKAELRRLMLEDVHTATGELTQRSFIVNIRTPVIAGGGKVSLKPRERASEAWAWDDKLTLEFNGERPCVSAVDIAKVDVPTVYILGDSTVCDQPTEPWNSWGQMLTRFFKPEIAIANNAESGETLKSSLHAHRLDKVLSTIRAGDYLLIQFGHNDMKDKAPNAIETYKKNLELFANGAKEKGATPVLITSMNRNRMDSSGKVINTLAGYPDAVREIAKQDDIALIDLNDMSKTLYEAIGPKDIGKAFQDGTHHNAYGSYELAKCIVLGIQQDHLDLAKYVTNDWKPFDPAHPDPLSTFHMAASPVFSNTKPLGN